MNNTVHIVIPSRYDSSRLPGKPLRLIAGKPMIEHVYAQARKTGITSIVVATDDQRIYNVVSDFGGNAVMTRSDHESGTDRLAEVCELKGWDENDRVINLQGDEPMMPPEMIMLLADLLAKTDAGIATLATPILEVEDVFRPHIVKVVTDVNGNALYFSRAPVPWDREQFSSEASRDNLGAVLPAN